MTSRSLRIVTFKIEPETLEALDRLASTLGVSRSDLIREAIERLLDEYGVAVEKKRVQDAYSEGLITIEVTL